MSEQQETNETTQTPKNGPNIVNNIPETHFLKTKSIFSMSKPSSLNFDEISSKGSNSKIFGSKET
jgi:hypothetical protein